MRTSARRDIKRFLDYDIGSGDITSRLLPHGRISANVISREAAVLAGAPFARTAFTLCGCRVSACASDGRRIGAGQRIMRVSGTPYAVLSAERTALNLLSRMSGIATQTHKLVGMLRGTRARLYATRKTAPGLSFFDKEAVSIGGGMRHRADLADGILIKDNHIAAARASGMSLEDLIRKAKKRHVKIEVEVEHGADVLAAARAGADVIMLDNFAPSRVKRAVAALEKSKMRKRVKLESSGGINARNIAAYAAAGVDWISVGAITSSVRAIDMSLEV